MMEDEKLENEEPAPAEVTEQGAEEPFAVPAGVDAQGRTQYRVKCSSCGKDAIVPFMPRQGGRPVTCSDCYRQQKNSR